MFSLKRLAACMLLLGFVIGLAPKPALAAITYDDRKLWRDANNDGIKQDAEVADIGVRLDIHRHDENENVPDLPGINSSPLPPSGFWIEAWIFNTSSQVLFLFNVDSSAKLAMKSVFFDDPSHYLKKLNETDKNWNTYSERLYNPFLSNMVKDTKDITVELNAGGKLIDDEAANVNADVFAVGGATANDMSGLVGNPAQIVAPHSTLPGISANNPYDDGNETNGVPFQWVTQDHFHDPNLSNNPLGSQNFNAGVKKVHEGGLDSDGNTSNGEKDGGRLAILFNFDPSADPNVSTLLFADALRIGIRAQAIGDANENSAKYWADMPLITSVVPEPSTLLLLGTGLVGLIGYKRRRKNS